MAHRCGSFSPRGICGSFSSACKAGDGDRHDQRPGQDGEAEPPQRAACCPCGINPRRPRPRIAAGESVTISVPAANHDPGHFAAPDTLDLRRKTSGHVAFGHGVHQCLGQQLARVQLQVALRALLARFPTLRLAVPAENIALRNDMLIYGVHHLPVAWEA